MAKARQPALKTLAAQYARTQLGQVLDLVREGKARFIVERNGQPMGAIVSIDDLSELLGAALSKPEALAALRAHSRRRGLDLLSLEDMAMEIQQARKGSGRKRKNS